MPMLVDAGIDVICAGNIHNLRFAQKIIAEGRAVAMGRAQVADSQIVNKMKRFKERFVTKPFSSLSLLLHFGNRKE